ncbi:hypothetical protein PR048_002476 [Dryococelus australis]|uniref:DDE Tnp4 domain-containing protein n=1 Tax=Dryococelus australis TaxID=614101 RepID=A0ABQ9ILS3_9NEOP|nr:hypothetical protein PR048_002476 [Dryococelus australis]
MNKVNQKQKKIIFAYVVYKWMSKKKIMWLQPHVNERFYFRMSVNSFDELVVKLEDGIKSENTKLRVAITPAEMLAITLRYLGSGCNLVDLHYAYRVGRSTTNMIVRKVCKTISNTLKDECIPLPTEEMWLNIADRFLQKENFPNRIGALDGKHIRILKSALGGCLYLNNKYYYSIVLLGVAYYNYRLIYIDVGFFGKESDSTVFIRSTIWDRIITNTINIPQS